MKTCYTGEIAVANLENAHPHQSLEAMILMAQILVTAALVAIGLTRWMLKALKLVQRWSPFACWHHPEPRERNQQPRGRNQQPLVEETKEI